MLLSAVGARRVALALAMGLTLSSVVVVGAAQSAEAAVTINVPADQPTIQAAIDAASNGDAVVVAPGTYSEHINFRGKAIEVRSSGGAAVTTIDGGGSTGSSVALLNSGETSSSVLRGFTVQHAGFAGAGIGIFGSSPTITQNVVQLNSSPGIVVSGGDPHITANVVTGNTACPTAGIDLQFSSGIVEDNQITHNTLSCVGGDVGGAGIRVRGLGTGGPQILSNTIAQNDALTSPGGGIALFGAGTPVIRDNVIAGNHAGAGGGIGYDENGGSEGTTAAQIAQNVVVANSASSGSALYLNISSGSSALVSNNTVADNDAAGGAGVVLTGHLGSSQLANNIEADTGVLCSTAVDATPPLSVGANNFASYEGSCIGLSGMAGNISADPHFLDAPGGDYHLQFASPSVDAGSNPALSLLTPPLTTDLDGNPRIVGGTVDQGAYELPAPSADPTGEFTSLTPARVVDTRDGTGGRLGQLGADSTFEVQIAGRGGVPASGVSAVVLNATVTAPTAPSFLTIYPTGVSRPFISNLNYVAGQTVPNLVTVAVGAGGKLTVYNCCGATDVVFDVVGYYSSASGPFGSRFHGLTPARFFDTRDGTGGVPAAPLGAGTTLHFTVTGKDGVPASGVTAVVMNVTVTQPTGPSFLTVFPDDVSRPLASNLNYTAGTTVPNLVVMRVPASGVVDFYNNAGSTHLLADVVGYYDGDKTTNGGRFIAVTPSRRFDSRVSSPAPPPGSLPGGSAFLLYMPGQGGLPNSGIGSTVVNVTAVDATAPSYVTVFPPDGPLPLASNLNVATGQPVPNLVIAKLAAGPPPQPFPQVPGFTAIYNNAGNVHIVVDVFGYFTASFTDLEGASTPGGATDGLFSP